MCNQGNEEILMIDGKLVGVDECIGPLVEALNNAGFRTVASCCGHGHRPGCIALTDGRELIIAANWDEARKVDSAFPDIQGNRDPEHHT